MRQMIKSGKDKEFTDSKIMKKKIMRVYMNSV